MLNLLRPWLVSPGRHPLIASLTAGSRAAESPTLRPQAHTESPLRRISAQARINQLLVDLGMPGLDFDSHGCARLLFDDQLVVNFESDPMPGLLHLYTDLGRLPASGCEGLYRALLEANLSGVRTSGAMLSVDANQNQAVLSRTLHVEALSPNALSQCFAAFVQCAQRWRRVLAVEQTVADEAAANWMPPHTAA